VSEPEPNSPIEPEDAEEVIDLSEHFEDLGQGPERKGVSADYPEPEVQWILRDIEKGRRSGKSYRPDPTGQRHAIKNTDYKSGETFFTNSVIIKSLEDVYELLKTLAPDPRAFLVRGKLLVH
jgi:hypothetical protein